MKNYILPILVTMQLAGPIYGIFPGVDSIDESVQQEVASSEIAQPEPLSLATDSQVVLPVLLGRIGPGGMGPRLDIDSQRILGIYEPDLIATTSVASSEMKLSPAQIKIATARILVGTKLISIGKVGFATGLVLLGTGVLVGPALAIVAPPTVPTYFIVAGSLLAGGGMLWMLGKSILPSIEVINRVMSLTS